MSEQKKKQILEAYNKRYAKTEKEMLDEWRELSADYDWWDNIYDYFIEMAEKEGIFINDDTITFDLHSTTGVNFGYAMDLEKAYENYAPWLHENVNKWDLSLYLAGSDHSFDFSRFQIFSNFCPPEWWGIGVDDGDSETFKHYDSEMERITNEIAKALKKRIAQIEEDMLISLRDEDDYLNSDEYLWENLEANFLEAEIDETPAFTVAEIMEKMEAFRKQHPYRNTEREKEWVIFTNFTAEKLK